MLASADVGDNAEIDQPGRNVAGAVDEQERFVETFNSNVALLENSLGCFGHTIPQFDKNDAVRSDSGVKLIAGDNLTKDEIGRQNLFAVARSDRGLHRQHCHFVLPSTLKRER
jgi:hypothetical protein